ncbi:hypothetical protein BHE74_00052111 [Ensete ventricosum]|nr:hypothetical protein BHE74_00052111 [Ensete ventricosum]RZS10756.1 hypothetical protein BHM03_00042021 [Ensete ventricosum]
MIVGIESDADVLHDPNQSKSPAHWGTSSSWKDRRREKVGEHHWDWVTKSIKRRMLGKGKGEFRRRKPWLTFVSAPWTRRPSEEAPTALAPTWRRLGRGAPVSKSIRAGNVRTNARAEASAPQEIESSILEAGRRGPTGGGGY